MASDKIKIVLDLSAEMSQVQPKLSQLQKQLNSIKIPGITQGVETDLTKIQERFEKLKELTEGTFSVKSDFSKAEKQIERATSSYQNLNREVERLEKLTKAEKLKLLPSDQQKQISKATQLLERYNEEVSKEIKKSKELLNAEKKLGDLRKQQSEAQSKTLISGYDLGERKKQQKALEKQVTDAQIQIDNKRQEYAKKGWVFGETGRRYKQDSSVKQVLEDYEKAKEALETFNQESEKFISQSEIDKVNTAVQNQETKVNELTAAWNKLKADTPQKLFEQLRADAEKLGVSLTDIGTTATKEDIDKLKTALSNLENSGIREVDDAIRNLKTQLDGIPTSLESISGKLDASTDEFQRQSEAIEQAERSARDLANLKNQVLDFFSVTGAIQLFRRAIQSAVETVKELDSAMTEIAVVSDFSVNDMWGQLPKFTDQANQLGVAISDAYEATTLFVQQGLDLNNSMKLATETLKMAAIAGMDASDATNSMTSA